MKNETNTELYGIYSFKAYDGEIVKDDQGIQVQVTQS